MRSSGVVAGLRAHNLDSLVAAVAARKGLEMSTWQFGNNIVQATAALDVAVTDSLVVSGSFPVLHAAKSVGAASSLGCVCGRDRRRYLADADTPVVAGLAVLTHALASA